MAIRFSCPNCGKALVVKDQLAGKRGACSGCKKVITIPFPVADAHHDDVDALAKEAFADEPAPAAAPVETKTIEFTCPMCDEKVQVSADLEGRQTPCPECRRIVKVPLQVRNEPKDWRKSQQRLPSGAKENLEPAPEGAWGSTAAAGVSREALLETGAIVEVEDPDARRQRQMRIVKMAIIVVVLGLGSLVGYGFFKGNKADKYMERALDMTKGESSKLPPEQAAVIHWAAAQYHARSRTPDAAQKTLDEYGQARAALVKATSLERDAMLIELALDQLQLGGGLLDWNKAIEAVRQTLDPIRDREARVEAVRQATRKLATIGQVPAAQSLAGKLGGAASSSDPNELVAAAALELFRCGNQKEARALAGSVFPPDGKSKAAGRAPISPSRVALAGLVGGEEPKPRLSGDKDEEKPNQDDIDSILLGKVEAFARGGSPEPAHQLLATARPAVRLRGLIALAALTAEQGPDESADLVAALDLAAGLGKSQEVSPWSLFELCRLAAHKGLGDRARQLAEQIPDTGLKAQAQLAVFRDRLLTLSDKADEALARAVAPQKGAAALALQALARHNVRVDGGWAKNVESWGEGDKAAGLSGAALAMQDKRK